MRGFTLVELLITTGIFLLLAAVSLPIYSNLQISTQLNEHAAQITQTLRVAKERATAGYNDSAHGVYFNINPAGADKYVLYQGASYATRATAYDQEVLMDGSYYFGNSGFTLTGTDIDVNFSKTLGKPNNTGTLTINHNISGQRRVIVNAQGAVTEN